MRQNSEYEKQLLDDITILEMEKSVLKAGVKNGHEYYLNVDEWNKNTNDELDVKLTDLFTAIALVRSETL